MPFDFDMKTQLFLPAGRPHLHETPPPSAGRPKPGKGAVLMCYGCGTYFRNYMPDGGMTVMCSKCRQKAVALATSVEDSDVPNGNLPKGVDRTTKGTEKPVERTMVRRRLMGERRA